MEWLKNFLTPFYERIKSPLYSTFIISWLIVNWKVIFAVFTSAKIINGCSKFDYLSCYLTFSDRQHFLYLFIFPLILTAIYIYIFPLIDNFIFEHVEEIRNKRKEKKLDILKKYKVSGDRFVDLLSNYNSQKDKLAKLENNLSVRESEIIKKEDLYTSLLESNNKLKKLSNYLKINNISEIFTGEWVLIWNRSNTRDYVTEFFKTSNEHYNILNDKKEFITQIIIESLKYDVENNSLSFIKINEGDVTPNKVKKVELRKTESDKDFFSGIEFSLIDRTISFDVQYMSIIEFKRREK